MVNSKVSLSVQLQFRFSHHLCKCCVPQIAAYDPPVVTHPSIKLHVHPSTLVPSRHIVMLMHISSCFNPSRRKCSQVSSWQRRWPMWRFRFNSNHSVNTGFECHGWAGGSRHTRSKGLHKVLTSLKYMHPVPV